MDFVAAFQYYLFSQKTPPSPATVKNYAADIRRLVRWYENRFKQEFDPAKITPQVLVEFRREQTEASEENTKTEFIPASHRSVERYMSSLRKFFSFMSTEKLISTNPFDLLIQTEKAKKSEDPWHLRGFKAFLYASKSSDLTIKNYIIDVQQFFSWLNKVAGENDHYDLRERNLFTQITPLLLEEYKQRLLHEAKISPSSVNRKLSSLRRYILWAQSQDYVKSFTTKLLPSNVNEAASAGKQQVSKPIENTSLEAGTVAKETTYIDSVKAAREQKAEALLPQASGNPYSSFPPLRLMQRLVRVGMIAFDAIIVFPLSVGLDVVSYTLWKAKGSPVFVDPNATLSAQLLSLIKRSGLLTKLPKRSPKVIASIPKSFYAPLSISVRHAPLHKKALYHLLHTRPNWYRRYHSYAISHYIHAGILIIIMSAAGFGIVQAVSSDVNRQVAFASLPDGPPRILSFKGKLTTADGAPITANTNLRFGIYNEPTATGSALLWEEVQSVIPQGDGSFQTLLGTIRAIPNRLFTENARLYIGMGVENNPELTPRKQIPTAVLAATAETVQGLRPITDPGSGQKNALLALDSSGNLTIGDNANPTFIATGGKFTLAGQTLMLSTAPGSNSDVQIVPDGLGKLDIQKPIHNTSESSSLSGVIGAVDIEDAVAINASGSGQSALYINQNSIGPLISASVSGIAKFTLENTGAASFGGNVMIGGSALSTTQTSFNLLTTNPINLSIGTSATAISLGAASGVTTINNSQTVVSGNLAVNGTKGATFGNANAGITFSGSGNHLISATSGSLQLGNVTLTGNATLNQNISLIPGTTDGENNLGSSSNPFDNLYVNTIISPSLNNANLWQGNNGILSPSQATQGILIGASASSSAVWQAFASGPNAGTASSSGNLTFTGANTTINQLNGGSITFRTSPDWDSGLAPQMTITNSGNIGIGTSNPQYRFDVGAGQAAGASSWYTYSSRRFKEDINPIYNPLEKILKLQGVYFTWKEAYGGDRDIGFIAEDVGAVLPELVEWEDDGLNAKSLKYDRLTALAIEGIKAQQAEINELQSLVGSVVFLPDRQFHITRTTGSSFSVVDDEGNSVSTTGAFARAFVATLQTGLAIAEEIRTQTLIATTSILGTASAESLTADYIDVSDLLVRGTLRAGQGIVLLLRTDMIASTEEGTSLSLGLGKTELTVYGMIRGEKQQVASIDDQGNAAFSGSLVAADADFNGLMTAENADITETLKAKKLVAEELELTNEGYVKLLSRLVLPNTSSQYQTSSKPLNIPLNVSTQSESVASVAAEPNEMIGPPPASASADLKPDQAFPPLDPALTTNYGDLASTSAQLSVLPSPSSYTTYNIATNSALLTTGPIPSAAGVVLPDLSVAGMVTIAGNFILNDTAIDVIGADLNLQPLKAGGVSFMAGLVSIDTSGNLTVNGNANFARDVTVYGKLATNIISPVDQNDLVFQLGNDTAEKNPALVIQDASGGAKLRIKSSGDVETEGNGSFSSLLSKSLNIMRGKQADASPIRTIASSSAGTATILPGQTQRTIITPFIRPDSLIYISPTSDTQGVIPYISRQTEENPAAETAGSFTIQISKAVNKEISINWWVVN